jgi:UDP-N-acetyl-D-glucosamine dehydrogenase
MEYNDFSKFEKNDIPIVCILGLGFVGSAMAVAIANASDSNSNPKYNVIGIDLPNEKGKKIVNSFNAGIFPFETTDQKLKDCLKKSIERKNLCATTNPKAISLASIILVDINLDLTWNNGEPDVNLKDFINGIRTIGEYVTPNSLVIVETTVPPGTCEKVVVPEIRNSLKKRGLPEDCVLVAHSYERVMPGSQYLDSIVNYWRVYAGVTIEAADRCMDFLSNIINIEEYPLTRLSSTTASETAKVLENSYRAVNIAFMEEWGRFAEEIGINMFEIVEAIRKRPTHSNIRQPGFGVGGYCLTKDPLFAKVGAEIFFEKKINFEFTEKAVEVNKKMPLAVLNKLKQVFGNDLSNLKILILGVSYRQDIGDTRNSPSEILVRELIKNGSEVSFHDPLVTYWEEIKTSVLNTLPRGDTFDAIILAVPHKEYKEIDFSKWLNNPKTTLIDTNNVLSERQIEQIRNKGNKLVFIGRGN